MAFPSVIQFGDKFVITSQIVYIHPATGYRVNILLTDGKILEQKLANYASQQAFLADLEVTLGITPAASRNMNPVKFDTTYSNPTDAAYTPPDITLGCMWFGIGGTFYSWNPDTETWIGIITL